MASKNDITGDLIQSKVITTQEFRDNFDKIFGKKEDKKQTMKISRIDIISTNGNDGEHYDEVDS